MKTRLPALCSAVALLWCSPAMAAKMVFGTTTITTEAQKPEVAVFISRQNLNKGYELELKKSFLDKIIDAVDHPPF